MTETEALDRFHEMVELGTNRALNSALRSMHEESTPTEPEIAKHALKAGHVKVGSRKAYRQLTNNMTSAEERKLLCLLYKASPYDFSDQELSDEYDNYDVDAADQSRLHKAYSLAI